MEIKAGQSGGSDVKKAYTKELFTASCNNSAIVETGRRVLMPDGSYKDEGVCAMAGCTYMPDNGQCQ